MIASEKARLKLSAPIQAFCERQIGVGAEMVLDANFVKLLMVKGPEGRDQGAKRVYQRKLCLNDLHDQVKVCLLCEGEAALGSRCTSDSGTPSASKFVINR